MQVVELAVPRPDEDPGAALVALRAILPALDEFYAEITGHHDYDTRADDLLSGYPHQVDARKAYLVALSQPLSLPHGPTGLPLLRPTDALDAATVAGLALLTSSRSGNDHAIEVGEFFVAPPLRRRGAGRALLEGVEQTATRWGCHTLQAWTIHQPADGAREDLVRCAESPFGIAPDAATRFATRFGFTLAQVERSSMQVVPEQAVAAPVIPEGYLLVSWTGVPPRELWDGVAVLMSAMSTDAPPGEFDIRPEPWDSERVERRFTVRSKENLIVATAALDADGVPAAFTEIWVPRSHPEGSSQEITLVHQAHRGRGLGLAVKQGNLVALQQQSPVTRRIHTWNASENDHMWAINERLGYRTTQIGGGWQKQL